MEDKIKSNPPLVDIEDIHLSFGKNEVLKGISLQVHKGDVVSIIGPSGSGKSTLLRTINGLAIPQKGRITVDNIRVDLLKTEHERTALRKRIGIVFQQFNLFPHLTVLDNITLGPIKLLGEKRKDAEAHAVHLLERVKLGHKTSAYPGELSGGQQQRVAIARALAMRPELVLFDEVTSALDPETVGEVLSVIRSLVHEGMTSILVTHEMQFAAEVSNSIVFTENGLIIDQGSPEKIIYNSSNQRIRAFVNALGGQKTGLIEGDGI